MIQKMKQLQVLIISVICLFGCYGNSEVGKATGQKAPHLLPPDTIENLTKEEIKNTKSKEEQLENQPCIEIQKFVFQIEQLGWISDTNRLKEVQIYPELDRDQISYFNSKPFYQIAFEESSLSKVKNRISEGSSDSFDYEFFKRVKNIWGYFYRDKGATEMISDGVIEQWEFGSEEEAKEGLKRIKRIGFGVYFNTNPYFYRIRNKLIIFQTRAMAFSFDQKSIFEEFERKN